MDLKNTFDLKKIEANIIGYESSNSNSIFLDEYKKALSNSNPKVIIDKIQEALSLGSLQLNSPIDGANSRAVASFNCQTGHSKNYILMKSDSNNFWIIVQYTSFINAIIYDNKFVYIQNGALVGAINQGLERALTFFGNLDSEKTVLQGFYLEHQRPFHFFYENLKGMQYVSNCINKEIINKYNIYIRNSFIDQKQLPYLSNSIDINDINATVHKKGFTIKPLFFDQYHYPASKSAWSKQAMKDMENGFKSTYTKQSAVYEGYDLVLWIGVTGQKRRWINQESNYSNIVKKLASYYADILVIVDGWTSKLSTLKQDEVSANQDREVYSKIAAECAEVATFKSVIGHSYESKINACHGVDFFIANAGSGAMVPLRFCQKDGVLHSNLSIFTFPDSYEDYNQIIKTVEEGYIVIPQEERNNSGDHTSYQISWKLIFNRLAEIINENRETKIPLLDLTLQDLDYLTEKETVSPAIVHKQLLLLSNQQNKSKYVSCARDIALILEKHGLFKTALEIFLEIYKMNPKDKFIEDKITQIKNKWTE